MPTKKKAKSIAKTEHHAVAKIESPKKEEVKPEEKEETEAPKPSGFVPRLDRKDERSEEERATDLEAKQKQKPSDEEELHIKHPQVPREVPHIDIPVLEDIADASLPPWHQVNDDLPAIAKPVNMPPPVVPSQPLTSTPPQVEAVAESTKTNEEKVSMEVTTLTDSFMPVDGRTELPKKSTPLAKPNSTHEVTSDGPKKPSSWPYFFGGIVVGILVLVAGVWGYMNIGKISFFNFLKTSSTQTQNSTSALIPPAGGSPTPVAASFDRAEVLFEVLNGSGVSGAAGKAGVQLKDLGYGLLKTGNAESVIVTELYLTADSKLFEDKIFADVSELFPQATIAGTLEDSDTTASARLIVGKK